MWKQFYAVIKQLLLLTHQTDENREQIKELRHQVRELASAMERLAYEVHRIDEKVDYYARNEAQERENLILRLENALLKSGRQLPPDEPTEDEAE